MIDSRNIYSKGSDPMNFKKTKCILWNRFEFFKLVLKGYAKLKFKLKPFGLFVENPFGFCRLL